MALKKKENLNKATKNFIAYAINDLLTHGVEVQLVQEPSVFCLDDGSFVSGYFDDFESPTKKAVLAVAINKPFKQWFPVFMHEYAHFLQYKEKTPLWPCSKDETLFWNWTLRKKSKKRYSREKIFQVMKAVQNLEIDCEKRAVNLIKKHKLQKVLPTKKYIQRANSYIWVFNYVTKYRKWYKPGKEPYNIQKIINTMPTTFNQDYNTLPEKYEKLVNKYCFIKNKKK